MQRGNKKKSKQNKVKHMTILQNFTIVKCYVFLFYVFCLIYECLKGFSRKFIVPGSRQDK